MDTKVITAHVPLSLAQKVDQMAARLERPRGWIVKQALFAWVEKEEERRRLTLEGLADVDHGRPDAAHDQARGVVEGARPVESDQVEA